MKLREELENDYEIAGVIVDEMQPYSLEYYLGIQHEGDEDFGGEGDEDDEDDDDDEDGGDKKGKKAKGSKSKSKSKSKGKDKKESVKTEEKPECKNQ